MLKTLVALVSAMTVTAAVLGWMDPSPPLPDDFDAQQLAFLAEEAVLSGVDLDRGRWRLIEVTSEPLSSREGTMLAAEPAVEASHFRVSLDGRVRAGRLWRQQRPLDEAPGAIRIAIARVDVSAPMSSGQWVTLRAMIEAINSRAAVTDVPLPVELDAQWRETYGLEQQTRPAAPLDSEGP